MTATALTPPEPAGRDPAHEERLIRHSGPLAINAPLVPAGYCRAVLAELEPRPCGLEAGNRLARLLVGSMPRWDVNDGRAYALAVASVFAEHPESVGRAAIDVLIRGCRRPPPAAAAVHDACAAIAGRETHRRASARRMLAEHARRRREADHLAEVERGRAAVLAAMDDPAGAWADLRHRLAAAKPAPVRRPARATEGGPAPIEKDAAEHAGRIGPAPVDGFRTVGDAAMAELEAAGVPTVPMNREGEI